MADLIPLSTLQEMASKYTVSDAAKATIGRGKFLATLAIHGAEYVGASWLVSYANARFAAPGQDHIEFRGVPLDATLGAAGIISAALGWFGDMDMHVAVLALGALTPATNRHATNMGMSHRIARERLAAQVANGQMPNGQAPAPQVAAQVAQPAPQQATVDAGPRWARRAA
jgi:hypothetical protein